MAGFTDEGMAKAPVAPRMSIDERLQNLSDSISLMDDAVSRVINRVDPVCVKGSDTSGELGSTPKEADLSKMSDRIVEATFWVNRITQNLNNVTNRIEL